MYNVGTLNGSVEIADHLRENDVATVFDSQGKPFVAFDEAADRSLVIRRRGSRGRRSSRAGMWKVTFQNRPLASIVSGKAETRSAATERYLVRFRASSIGVPRFIPQRWR